MPDTGEVTLIGRARETPAHAVDPEIELSPPRVVCRQRLLRRRRGDAIVHRIGHVLRRGGVFDRIRGVRRRVRLVRGTARADNEHEEHCRQ
jgi:hypothetical protein